MHGGGILCLARSGVRHRLVRAGLRGSPGARLRGHDRDAHARGGARDRAVARRRRALRRAHERRSLRAPRVADGRARREAARPAASSCASRWTSPACAAAAPAGRSRRAGGAVEAEAVVVTAGAATPPLLRPFGLRVPIVAAKGYSLTLQGEGVAAAHRALPLRAQDRRLRLRRRRAHRRHVRAARAQPRRSTASASATSSTTRCPFIRGWKPAPGEAEQQGWAGFRPATPDSLPLLGPIPGQERPLRRRRPRHAGRHAGARHGRGGGRHGDDGRRARLAGADGAAGSAAF